MNDEYGLELQNHNLQNLEQRIAGIKTGRFPTHQRSVHIAIIKNGLEGIRKNIVERNKYWQNIEKLESLEDDFASLEESEKRKPLRSQLSI